MRIGIRIGFGTGGGFRLVSEKNEFDKFAGSPGTGNKCRTSILLVDCQFAGIFFPRVFVHSDLIVRRISENVPFPLFRSVGEKVGIPLRYPLDGSLSHFDADVSCAEASARLCLV